MLRRDRLFKIGIYFIVFLFIFINAILISKTLFYDKHGDIKSSFNGYGDIPFHLTQVTHFGNGSLFDFSEPIFLGDRIRYAFFVNWVSGFFLKITNNLVFSFHFPVIVFMALGVIFTFLIYRKILKKDGLALLAFLIFFLGSGFGSYYLFINEIIPNAISFNDFFNFIVRENISTIINWDNIFPQQNIVWGAPLTLFFVHQRAFFAGYLFFVLFFYFLLKFNETKNRRFFYFIILVVGLSPLVHYHSFLVMLIVLFFFLLLQFFKKNKSLFKETIWILFFSFLFSLPSIFYLTSGKENILLGENSFIKFRLGWMSEMIFSNFDKGVFSLWDKIFAYGNFIWMNFGVILPIFLIAACCFLINFKKDRKNNYLIYYFIICGLFIFFLNQFIKFQPWDFDNNKILNYYQFFAAPVVILFFFTFLSFGRRIKIFTFILFFILAIHSGIIDIIPKFFVPEENMPVIFNKKAQQIANYVRSYIPEKKVILTSSTHLNPVSSLAGHSILLGYPGWLWTKGYNCSERENDLKNFYQNPQNKNILNKYKTDYIILDPQAINDWKAKEENFDFLYKKIFNNDEYYLYRIE